MVVPPAGETVWADALPMDGGPHNVAVQSRPNGVVAVFRGASLDAVAVHAGASAAAATSTSVLGECNDSNYTLYSTKWTQQYLWYFKSSTTPSNISQSKTISALRAAITNVTQGQNNCGMNGDTPASSAYQGTTSTSPNITSSGGCGSRDQKNVVDFGTLPSTYLALTCWWSSNGTTIEADVRLNKASYGWVTSMSGCTGKWMVQAAATHEFGHAFGLGHVTSASDANMTMYPSILACSNNQVSLGKGDILGLEAKY